MEGMTVTQILAMMKPLSLPLLLWLGRWLKTKTTFSNKLIPWAILVLNGGSWGMLHLGLATSTNGGLEAVTPEVIGVAAVGVPLLAVMAWGFGGFGSILGTALSIGMDQFFVNAAHKGLKYRAMFKLAEATGVIPKDTARGYRLKSRW